MCRVADIAKYSISKAIELRNIFGDEKYYMDFYKLNKVLYLAQGLMLKQSGKGLFKEDIYAYTCGPYIRELEFVFKDWEYELITTRYPQEIELPPSLKLFLDEIIEKYGRYNKRELGITTKKQTPWKETYVPDEPEKIIDLGLIKEYFSQINDLNEEIKNAQL